jgi:hypothetical protein
MTTARTSWKLVLAAALALPLVLGLAACGKKGSPKPPEGQEADYTYPRAYPAPETVVPGGSEESGPARSDSPLWIFGTESRTKTKTY